MKLFFSAVFLLLLLSFGETFSQTIKWSQPLQDIKKTPYMSILGTNESDNFFVLRSNISLDNDREHSGFRNRIYMLQCYSSELNPIWERELKTSYENGHIADVRLINGNVIVTSYISDKKSKRYYFYAQYIDGDGKWIGQPTLLDSLSTEYMDEDNKPGLITSRDQNFIAFSYRKTNKENTSQFYQLVVMDTTLIVKYKKEIEVPVSTELFVPHDFLLTNQGSFFILASHYTTEKRVKEPDQIYYELYGYSFPFDKVINTTIRSEGKFLTDVGISADNINRSIVVAGFYSDKTTYSVAGVFYYALNEDSLHETKTINTPFSDEYLMKFLGEKKENRELVNYSIDRLIVRKDGGVALIAESVYETSRSYYDYFMQTYVNHIYHHFGNIMLLSVNPDGNIKWNNIIAKDQNSVDDGGYLSSYISAVTVGKLVILYNKYIEDDSSVLITFVEAGGTIKTEVLIKESERAYIIPKAGRQIDDETILLPAYKGNKYYILKISF